MIISRLSLAAALVLSLIACHSPAQVDIPFAPLRDDQLKDPENPTKVFRVDLARVERVAPLTREHRMRLTPENIKNFTQEEIDQIYGRLTAGPIPDGVHAGDLFFARGEGADEASLTPEQRMERRLRPRLEEIVGGIEGRFVGRKLELIEDIGRVLWKGKAFFREERVLRNLIADALILRPLIDDLASVPRVRIERRGALARLIPRDEVWLLFPAKLHCGQSLLDARRESVIIDYLYADEIQGYRASPDSLATRGGLRIRDEIRMVRPGFYLGRAYANRMFLLNFIVYDEAAMERDGASFAAGGAIAEDCWPGEQGQRAAMR
jgi:hypothetical protein